MASRLPRFKRAPTVAPMQLTERDHQIIRLVHRHRFLRSYQIIALLGGSPQHLLRRLKLLYHHGFLERPRAQIDYYHQPGSRHIIYGLGNKSWMFLKQELGDDFREVSWETWTMLEPTGIKRNVQPHSYTHTSKKSLDCRTRNDA